ncbi:MAG: hypothetical protein ACOCYW_08630 [Roseicyclus sp.]
MGKLADLGLALPSDGTPFGSAGAPSLREGVERAPQIPHPPREVEARDGGGPHAVAVRPEPHSRISTDASGDAIAAGGPDEAGTPMRAHLVDIHGALDYRDPSDGRRSLRDLLLSDD